MSESWVRAFCALILLVLPVAPLPAEEPSRDLASRDSLDESPAPEVLDDPPAAFAARDDPAARSPGTRAPQGGYAYTHDGGEVWTFPGVLEPGVFRSNAEVRDGR